MRIENILYPVFVVFSFLKISGFQKKGTRITSQPPITTKRSIAQGFQITIRAIDEKNIRTGCRGSLAREGGSLESYWRFAPREFKSPPRRMYLPELPEI